MHASEWRTVPWRLIPPSSVNAIALDAGLPRLSFDRALWALRLWLDSWAGIAADRRRMAHQGFDLQLTGRGGRRGRR